MVFIDLAEGTRSEIGIVFPVSLPGTGIVLFDRGRLVADNLGEGPLCSRPGHIPLCTATSTRSALP